MRQPLAGQVALVTGSSRGIGRALALELARQGAELIVTARTEAPRPDLPGTTLTLGLAKELRPFGIAVVSVDPGFTLTEHCATLGPAGGLDTSFAHPVDVPVRAVLDVVCAADPMAYTGQCLSAAPPPPFARQP